MTPANVFLCALSLGGAMVLLVLGAVALHWCGTKFAKWLDLRIVPAKRRYLALAYFDMRTMTDEDVERKIEEIRAAVRKVRTWRGEDEEGYEIGAHDYV